MVDSSRTSVGRPRSESSRKAILDATIELLEQSGYSSLTVEGIASHAEVSKATIYRWWNNKTMVVLDAFLMLLAPQAEFSEGSSVRDKFLNQLKGMANVLNSTMGRSMLYVIAGSEPNSEVVKAFHLQYIVPKRNDAKRFIENGIEQGEIRSGIEADVILDMIYGPIYFRILVHKKMVDHAYIESLMECVLQNIQNKKG